MSTVSYVRPGTARALSARPLSSSQTTSSVREALLTTSQLAQRGRIPTPGDRADDLGIYDDDEGGSVDGSASPRGGFAVRQYADTRTHTDTRTPYIASQLSRPLVVTTPGDVSGRLQGFARRDLLHSAKRRISAARGAGKLTEDCSRVATAIVDWQIAARNEATQLKQDPHSELGSVLRELDDHGASEVAGMLENSMAVKTTFKRPASAYDSRPSLASTTARLPSDLDAGGKRLGLTRAIASAGPVRATHANKVLARYGDGTLSGGAGDGAERFLFRRQVDLVQSRNEVEVSRALSEWRDARNALDAEIEMRIQARRRPNSVSLVTALDYGGSVKAALQSTSRTDKMLEISSPRDEPMTETKDDLYSPGEEETSPSARSPGFSLRSPVVMQRPGTAQSGIRTRPSLVQWWQSERPQSASVNPSAYAVPKTPVPTAPGKLFVSGFLRPSIGSTAALAEATLPPMVQATEALSSVGAIRERMQQDQRLELERIKESLAHHNVALPIEVAERALRLPPHIPQPIQIAQLQASGKLPAAPGLPKPKPASAGGAKGKPAAKPAAKGTAADPAATKPFPGQGIGLLTGELRPFSAGSGGGASFFGYPENPLKVAARIQAIKDEVLGTGKKKKGASPKKTSKK